MTSKSSYGFSTWNLLCLSVILLVSCTKTKNSTIVNNNSGTGKPTFAINGVSNIVLTNNSTYGSISVKELTVLYLDSIQETVTLSISSLPGGIFLDSTEWVSTGIPTFTTNMVLSTPTDTGVNPGSYSVTITATTESGKMKKYPFTLIIQGFPTTFLGQYDSCKSSCDGNSKYPENVVADGLIRNKIWFTNFRNSGNSIYGLLSHDGSLSFPVQAFGNDTLKSASANVILTTHSINISATINTTNCQIQLR